MSRETQHPVFGGQVMSDVIHVDSAQSYPAVAGDIIIQAGMDVKEAVRGLSKELDLVSDEIREVLDEVDAEGAPLGRDIYRACNKVAKFLADKNRAYGNSAANPIGIFARRMDTLSQIDVRIDDKLNRLSKGSEYPGDDTVLDLAGYLVLRMIVASKEEADDAADS